jgi:hypothetical protein
MHLIIFIVFISIVFSCHPECTYQCDAPVCSAVCKHICQPPHCTKCVMNPNTNVTTCNQPILFGCSIACPDDQCESDSCPICTLNCNEVLCDGDPYCSILCQEVECSWACQKPTDCPYPTCELACEQPACMYQGDSRRYMVSLLLMVATSFVMLSV